MDKVWQHGPHQQWGVAMVRTANDSCGSGCGCGAGAADAAPGRRASTARRAILSRAGRALSWPLVVLIKAYQRFISPLSGPSCRFVPSCSQYALDALESHGPLVGAWLALWRLLRCNPLNGGGYDPVPPPPQRACGG